MDGPGFEGMWMGVDSDENGVGASSGGAGPSRRRIREVRDSVFFGSWRLRP